MDGDGNPVYRPAAGAKAFREAMAKSVVFHLCHPVFMLINEYKDGVVRKSASNIHVPTGTH